MIRESTLLPQNLDLQAVTTDFEAALKKILAAWSFARHGLHGQRGVEGPRRVPRPHRRGRIARHHGPRNGRGSASPRSVCFQERLPGLLPDGPLVTVEPTAFCTRASSRPTWSRSSKPRSRTTAWSSGCSTRPADGKHCRGPAEIPFYRQQRRTVLRSCGKIDPEDIREYIHQGGYSAAQAAYRDMAARRSAKR